MKKLIAIMANALSTKEIEVLKIEKTSPKQTNSYDLVDDIYGGLFEYEHELQQENIECTSDLLEFTFNNIGKIEEYKNIEKKLLEDMTMEEIEKISVDEIKALDPQCFKLGELVKITDTSNYTDYVEFYETESRTKSYLENTTFQVIHVDLKDFDKEEKYGSYQYELIDYKTSEKLPLLIDDYALERAISMDYEQLKFLKMLLENENSNHRDSEVIQAQYTVINNLLKANEKYIKDMQRKSDETKLQAIHEILKVVGRSDLILEA